MPYCRLRALITKKLVTRHSEPSAHKISVSVHRSDRRVLRGVFFFLDKASHIRFLLVSLYSTVRFLVVYLILPVCEFAVFTC